jgi:hypothetical protein
MLVRQHGQRSYRFDRFWKPLMIDIALSVSASLRVW